MSNSTSSGSTSTSTAAATKPVTSIEAGAVFADPVAYLASLGLESSLVTGTTLRAAA